MDNEQARARLLAERAEVEGLLRDTERAGQEDRETEDDVAETGDVEGLYKTGCCGASVMSKRHCKPLMR